MRDRDITKKSTDHDHPSAATTDEERSYQPRTRKIMITTSTSCRDSDENCVYTKDKHPPLEDELKSRYRWRIFLVGGFLAAGLLGILIARSFDNRRSLGKHERVLAAPDPELPQPASWSKLWSFKRAAICADGTPCASIGKSMLDRNGSAVDAAIAAMICNGLINMQSMGIGGGFFMTFYQRSTGQAYYLNARETAPLASARDMFENGPSTASRIGGLAIGVPGEISGYWEAHQRFGKLPWSELFEPTIRLCHEGYILTKSQYDALFVHPPNIHDDPTLREMFVEGSVMGTFKKPGTLIRPKKLCETMSAIAENGALILYNGSLGESLIEDLKKRGSILTMQDLNDFRSQWSEPVETSLKGGLRFISSSLPSSGPLLAFILNVLENYDFNSQSLANVNETTLTYHRLIETWKYAYAMRTQLGDDQFNDLSQMMEKLLSKSYAQSIKEAINDDRTWDSPEHYGASHSSPEDHGTTHISVLAPNGDAVSVTSTINIYFGCGIVSESTGILMNSAMDDFGTASLANYFGIPAGRNNFIEPGKRSFSSMAPSIIVRENNDVRMIVGAAGGTKITSALSFVIARQLWMNDTIKEAVDAPRIHHQLFPMSVSYEFGLTRPVLDGLTKLGHEILRYRDRGSVICALAQINGTIYANVDYRKNGDVCGID